MSASSKPVRRFVLLLAVLGLTVCALPFAFIINDDIPPPNGTGLPIKWPAGTIRLRIMLGETANLSDGSSFNQSARTAAQTWNAVLGAAQFQTELVAAGNATEQSFAVPRQAPVNELAFADTAYGRSFGENTLAITTTVYFGNERLEADVLFNKAYAWDSYRGAIRRSNGAPIADIQRVALHELGHVLGLDHPDEHGQQVAAIMNSTIGNRYELSDDDIGGGQSLYGPPGTPANDAFANATVITLNPATKTATVKGYNTNATKEAGEPSHADAGGTPGQANPGGRSVWWRWTAPSNGNLTVDTRGSYFDTLLGIYTGNAVNALTRIAGSDDIDPGVVQASSVTFNAPAGTVYRIAVDGFNNDDGTGADNAGITLNLSFDGELGDLPLITSFGGPTTGTRGTPSIFSVTAVSGTPVSYQWLFNGNPISGATGSSYRLESMSQANVGDYSVIVSNAAGSVTSTTLRLELGPSPPPSAPPGNGGGGGGGGSPSLGLVAVLALLALVRRLRGHASV